MTRLLSRLLNAENGSKQPRKSATKRRSRRRRARKGASAPLPALPAVMPGAPRSVNPFNNRGRISGDEGSMRVSRQELCAVLTTGASGDVGLTVLLDPYRSGEYFPWLHGLATSWERICWHGLRLSWRSAVGATADGMVCYGVDFNNPPTAKSADRETVVTMFPVHDGPVWQSTDSRPLSIPAHLLRTRAQYILGSADFKDAGPGSVRICVHGASASKMVGELWLHYDVTMIGPKKVGT